MCMPQTFVYTADIWVIFTSRVSGRGNSIGPVFMCFHVSVFPCFRVSVCQLVSALMAKPLDIRTRKLVEGLSLIKSGTSILVKVIGQGHEIKSIISRIFWLEWPKMKSKSMVQRHDIMAWCHDAIWHHGVASWCQMVLGVTCKRPHSKIPDASFTILKFSTTPWRTANSQYMYMCLSPRDCLSAQKDFVFKMILNYGCGRCVNDGAFSLLLISIKYAYHSWAWLCVSTFNDGPF